jgi:opine dehydrogenase
MKTKRIIILGAGNGGQAMAAFLSLSGHEVVLYDRYEEAVAPILQKGGIELSGVSAQGFARLAKVTTDLKEALLEKGLIIVVLPAFAHAYIAEQVAPLLRNDDVIILSPGSTGGALEFRKVLTERGAPKDVKVGETNTLIYACRMSGPGHVKILGVKEYLGVAALPAKDAEALLAPLKELYPQAYAEKNVLSTGLNNLNPMFHVFPTLANLGWLEATQGNFKFYHDGVRASVAKLVEAVDRERMMLCQSLGIPTLSVLEWQKNFYGASGGSLPEVLRSNRSYDEIQAPSSKETRLLTEDVPMGLVPMSEIAKIAGVPTPFMDSAILLASEIMGQDYRATGRNLEAMGLVGLNKEELLHRAEEGNESHC